MPLRPTGFWYAVGGAWLYLPDKARRGDNLGSHTATQALNLGHAPTGTGAGLASGSYPLRYSIATARFSIRGVVE